LPLYARRMWRILFISFFLWSLSETAFSAEKRYASIVVDADTLEIIHARQIDELRFPASLTKVMTLYLTFDALNSGKLNLKEPIRVSRIAAQTPPSKLGLKAGQTITVEKLIQAVAVKSANDAAVVLAERLAGSESAFADKMTAKARNLGMLRTTFKTANGLPHPDQKTSARDMAKLASNILRHHRRYYHYFGLTHFGYAGQSYKNTNKLLHWLDGVDGFKTGYTRDSGYNLIISAQRDNRRLIAVVLGGASGKSRNQHMQDLVERSFDVMGVAPIKSLPPITVIREPIEQKTTPQTAISKAIRLRGRNNRSITIDPHNRSIRFSDKKSDDNWGIQVGAYIHRKDAQNQLDSVNGVTGITNGVIRPMTRNGQKLYRARFENLNITKAQAACKALANLSTGCFIVATN